jgi:crossover junction endodeoxyribonuclease RuvC
MVIIGIDPGFSGAWGMIDHNGKYIACGDMLHDEKHVHANAIYREITNACGKEDRVCVLEFVASRPGQSAPSMFKFGMAYGAAISICERLGDWRTVTPQVWKKSFGLSKDKLESLVLARSLWPDAPLSRMKDNGRAEALLLSEWMRRELE